MKLLASMCVVFVTAALFGVTAGQDQTNADAVMQEIKKLEGTWYMVSFEQYGEKTRVCDYTSFMEVFGFNEVTTIKDGKMTFLFYGKTTQSSLMVDPAKNPKTLIRTVIGGGGYHYEPKVGTSIKPGVARKKPITTVIEEKPKGGTYHYLYELELDKKEDTLRLCYDPKKSNVPPKTFKSEGTITILTFKRFKP